MYIKRYLLSFNLAFCVIDLSRTKMYILTIYYFNYFSTSYWISDLKCSVYAFFHILALFKSLFLACLDNHAYHVIHILKYWSLMISKLRKLHRKTWMRKNTDRQFENFEAFERVVILLLYSFFDFFKNRWVTLLSNKNLLENIFNGIIDEKWPIILILEVFFLIFAGYESSKILLGSIMLKSFSDKL